MESLDESLEEELKDIYSAEKQLLKALPRMAKKASSGELKAALTEHLSVTEAQVARLESVFEALGKPAKAKTCKAMQGLIEEAKEVMEEDATPAVMDAAIIAAACSNVVSKTSISSPSSGSPPPSDTLSAGE